MLLHSTIAFHCSEMASLSDGTSGQSKIFLKSVKTLGKSLTNHLLHSSFDLQMNQIFKKNHLWAIFGF